jgi:hypothetical protein
VGPLEADGADVPGGDGEQRNVIAGGNGGYGGNGFTRRNGETETNGGAYLFVIFVTFVLFVVQETLRASPFLRVNP